MDRKILRRHVKEAIQYERELFRLAVLVFAYNAEEIVLQFGAGDVRKRLSAELQTFQQDVLTPWKQLCVQTPHITLLCLFRGFVHLFQVLYGKPFFAFSQVVIYGLQVFSLMFQYGARSVSVPRQLPRCDFIRFQSYIFLAPIINIE